MENRAIQRPDLRIAVILAAVTFIAGAIWIHPRMLGNYYDDGVYVTTAKALAEGRGYRIISLPNAPLQTKYPIVYPLALALLWKLWPSFPQNIVLLKGFGLACASASVGLAYLYLFRFGYCSRRTAMWAAALAGTSPFFLTYAREALSDSCFPLLVVTALWRLDRLREQRDVGWRASLLTGMALGLPFLIRSIGVVFGASAVTATLQWRRRTAWVVLGVLLVWLPWILWTVWVLRMNPTDPVTKYQTDYLGMSGNLNGGANLSFWWSEAGRQLLPTMLLQNIVFALWSGALPLGGVITFATEISPRLLILMIAAGAPAWWMVATSKGERNTLKWFLLFYVFVVCVWPWKDKRFFMPVLPLLAAFLISAGASITRSVIAKRHFQIVAKTALIAAMVLNLLTLIPWRTAIFTTAEAEDQQPRASWSQISAALNWLKTNAAPHDVVAAAEDPMVYLYTNLKAIEPFVYQPANLFYGAGGSAVGTLPDFVGHLERYHPRFLLYYPVSFGGEAFGDLIQSAIGKYPGWIRQVYRGRDPRVAVYEIDWNHGP